jgi:hypothetical protein
VSSRRIVLEPGTWYAGFHDQPFFVSDEMIESYLAKYGFTDIEIHERAELALVLPFDPRNVDPKYTETWESWAKGKYSGPTKTIEIPSYSDYVDWLVVIPVPKPKAQAQPKPASPPNYKEFWPVAAIAAGYWWLRRKSRRTW